MNRSGSRGMQIRIRSRRNTETHAIVGSESLELGRSETPQISHEFRSKTKFWAMNRTA